MHFRSGASQAGHDAPVWECGNGHQEVEIPNPEKLHRLLVNLLIRKGSVLTGSEIRFLRKELVMSGSVRSTTWDDRGAPVKT